MIRAVLFALPLLAINDNCFEYKQKNTPTPDNPGAPQSDIAVSKGKELTVEQKAAVGAALEKIREWEEHCGVAFPDPNGGPPKKPSGKLDPYMMDGKICAETKTIHPLQPDAITGSPGLDGVQPPDPVPGWDVTVCHGEGVNINPDKIPTPTGTDTEGNFTFDESGISDLAGILVHEAFHALFPPQTIQEAMDSKAIEAPAYRAAAKELCKVAGCNHASVTQADKEAACRAVRNSNQKLCFMGKMPECCAACDSMGGSVDPTSQSPTCDCSPPPVGDPPHEREQSFLHLPTGEKMVLSILDDGSDDLMLRRRGSDGSISCAASIDLNAVVPSLVANSTCAFGDTRFLVGGLDTQTGQTVFAFLAVGATGCSITNAGEVYRGYDTNEPTSMVRLEGTPTVHFDDLIANEMMAINTRLGVVYTYHDPGTQFDLSNYPYSVIMSDVPVGGGVSIWLFKLPEEPVNALSLAATLSAWRLVDNGADGVVNAVIPPAQ